MNPPKILVQQEPIGPVTMVEIPVLTAGVSQQAIQDQPLLRSQGDKLIIIKGMTVITPEVLAFANTTGNPVSPLTEMQKISLQLYSNQWIKMDTIPILLFNSMFTEGSGNPWAVSPIKLDDWIDVDWNKSKLLYSNGTVSVGTPYSVLFYVQYLPVDRDTKQPLDFFRTS